MSASCRVIISMSGCAVTTIIVHTDTCHVSQVLALSPIQRVTASYARMCTSKIISNTDTVSQLSPGIILMSGGPMMVAYYKVNYLPVGVRIRFRVNCGSRVFGVRANLSCEIG